MTMICQAGMPSARAAWTGPGPDSGGYLLQPGGSGGSAQESSRAGPGDAEATAAGRAMADATGTLAGQAMMPAHTADGVDGVNDGLLSLLGSRPVNRGPIPPLAAARACTTQDQSQDRSQDR